jgi:hypothetical protein
MRVFIVDLENRPGQLAGLAETIAAKGINITGVSGSAAGDSGAVGLMTDDESATEAALAAGSFRYHACDVVTARLTDRPGTLADAARRLATAGINVDLVAPIGMEDGTVTVAFGVDKADAARQALGELAG